MIVCPSCQAEQSDSDTFCSACGAALSREFDDTLAFERGVHSSDRGGLSSRSSSSYHGRFLPGTQVANRYRIVSLVGKGGMGEVYRADDLKLGHPVALKFLPVDLASDPQRLESFHNEVRLTRQISHPNVCRIHDIGEVDGQHFLSMEYIDGEDCRVLLRRIGRLPRDKGLQIAQQLCAGLAAAHDRGVLHRDLKPANIMIDGHGQVRITDFGLARLAEEDRGNEIAGTPAYMAPEQLARGEATIQSDLYALGLILYELFTGEAVYKTSSIRELISAHQEITIPQPSHFVEDIDPTVERTILRCLAYQSHERPKTAQAVAASLPGGDFLAAAIAAGQTPSPEMVATAGETGTLSFRTGIAYLVALMMGLAGLCWLSPLMQPTPMQLDEEHAPEDLTGLNAKVRAILEELGYYNASSRPKHAVFGLQLKKSLTGEDDWEFWYRQRRDDFITPVIPEITRGPKSYEISMSNPPSFLSGMVSVRTDLEGNLIELMAAPDSGPFRELTKEQLMVLAGRPSAPVTEIKEDETRPSNSTPPVERDEERMYRLDDGSGMWVITALKDNGQLVYFYAGPVIKGKFVDRQFASVETTLGETSRPFRYNDGLELIVLIASILLTLRNVRLGRADRTGAIRLALWLGGFSLLVWLLGLHHVTDPIREGKMLRDYLRVPWLAYVFRHWLYYMALEPYIRRYWPNVLIAWSRAVQGRLRDPLFGQQLLIGSAIGVVVWLVCVATYAGSTGAERFVIRFDINSPLRPTATLLFVFSLAVGTGVWYLMVLFLIRTLTRDTRLSVVALVILYVGIFQLDGELSKIGLVVIAIWSAGLGLAITRFGLIAGIAYIFAQALVEVFPITSQVTLWYGSGTLVALGAIILVAGYGLYISTLAFSNQSRAGTELA